MIPRLGMRGIGPTLGAHGEYGPPGGATYHGRVIVREDHLELPLCWKKPRKVFVNSLSDTFHERVPNLLLDRAFDVMNEAQQHTYILLTKRPAVMRAYLALQSLAYPHAKRSHIWAGISASDEETLATGLDDLRATNVGLRILSLEPLLDGIDLAGRLNGIGWVIVGGESGRQARPCQEQWIYRIVAQCRKALVPVFVKSLGAAWASEQRSIAPSNMGTKGNEPWFWPPDLRAREVPRG